MIRLGSDDRSQLTRVVVKKFTEWWARKTFRGFSLEYTVRGESTPRTSATAPVSKLHTCVSCWLARFAGRLLLIFGLFMPAQTGCPEFPMHHELQQLRK